MSQLHWKDSYLVIEPGRLYLGLARAIRVTMAPGPLGREQPLQSLSLRRGLVSVEPLSQRLDS